MHSLVVWDADAEMGQEVEEVYLGLIPVKYIAYKTEWGKEIFQTAMQT